MRDLRVPTKLLQRNSLLLLLPVGLLGLVFLYPTGDRPAPLLLTSAPFTPMANESSLPERTFLIHVWRHGERMRRRFLRSYGPAPRDPYQHCAVRNCRLTTRDAADAVLFHLHQTKGPHTLPLNHPPNQVWIFFTDESPFHTFLATRKYGMRDYNGLFNWSMTYRSDADVPVPYGRTVPLTLEEKESYRPKNYFAAKSKGVAILGSNCGGQNYRWEYVRELQKHMEVDVFGGCGTRACPGHFTRDCPLIADYRFYLAFENSDCRQYATEKLWWHALGKDTVPVVMGPPREDYERMCPPNSFVHVADFESPAHLAKYLKHLLENETAYNTFFDWKREYKVLNEHGYFGSPSLHLCRICEALNRHAEHPRRKVFRDLSAYWSRDTDCFPPAWEPPDR